MRKRESLINTIKRRVSIRPTKSDQFLEVRDMPIKDVILEMDEFFNRLKTIDELYKKLRLDFVRTTSIELLAEIDKAKKGFVRAVTLVRTFRDSIPKWDKENNLSLAKKLFDKGYQEEAYTMCESLGVSYHDYFAPIKYKKAVQRKKRSHIPRSVLEILEKNNPSLKEPKVVTMHEGPKETYHLYLSAKSYCVHNKRLLKNNWVPTHLLHCVEVTKKNITFTPNRPKVGQYVTSRDGKNLQVQFVRKKSLASLAIEEKERKKLELREQKLAEKQRIEKEARLKREKEEKKRERYKKWKESQSQHSKEKKEKERLNRIAKEQERKKQEKLERERVKLLSNIKIKKS